VAKPLLGRAKSFTLRHHTGLTVIGLSLLLALAPFLLANPFQLDILSTIGIFVIVVLGLNLFIGSAGQVSLGHAAFFGLGAYGSAILTTAWHFSPWVAMLLTALLVAAAALILGLPILRLKGHYLAMATLGFNYMMYLVFLQWDRVTGGDKGISNIPYLQVGGLVIDNETRFHYLVWTFALISLTLCLNLVRTGVGRGLAALAQDEEAAACLGVDVWAYKVKVFVLSAILASLAGSLLVHKKEANVNPDFFTIFKSLDLVIMVVVGGLGSVWGTLLGVSVVVILPHLLGPLETYYDLVHGLILVLILMFLPQGLVTGLWDHIRLHLARRRLAGG
jgi:branched-chain amino acid transport system permease protein